MFSFSYLNTLSLHTHTRTRTFANTERFEYLDRSSSLTYVQRDISSREERIKRRLVAERGQQTRKRERKMTRAKRKRGEEQPNGENHNHNDNNNRGPNERGNKRETVMHTTTQTHTHTHTRISIIKMALETKWKERQTDKKTKNGTRERNLVVEQGTKDPRKFSHLSQKIDRKQTEKEEELGRQERKQINKQTNKQMTSCFISSASMRDPERRRDVLSSRTVSKSKLTCEAARDGSCCCACGADCCACDCGWGWGAAVGGGPGMYSVAPWWCPCGCWWLTKQNAPGWPFAICNCCNCCIGNTKAAPVSCPCPCDNCI